MKVKTCLIIFLAALISACATKDIPDNAQTINEECGYEMHAARSAIRLRDKGKAKKDLLTKLAPIDQNSSRLLIKMHEISNEVYQYAELNEVVYSTYRFELCQRELLHKTVPDSLPDVLPLLLQCQQRYADKSSVKSTSCILDAVNTKSSADPSK